MTCIHKIIRVFACISLLFSLGVIIVNVWLFGSILYFDRGVNNGTVNVGSEGSGSVLSPSRQIALRNGDREAGNMEKPNKNETKAATLAISASDIKSNNTANTGLTLNPPLKVTPNDVNSGVSNTHGQGQGQGQVQSQSQVTGSNKSPDPVQSDYHHWAELKKMPGSFKGIILGCTWMAVLGGIIQFCSSAVLLLQMSKRMSSAAKYTIGIHFIGFAILLTCFLTPLVYNRDCDGNGSGDDENDNDSFHEESSHQTHDQHQCNVYLSWDEFRDLAQEKWNNMATNLIHFIRDDLNSYFAFIGIDIVVLIINMFALSSLLQCNSRNKRMDSKTYNSFY